jgi:hypothetical protein
MFRILNKSRIPLFIHKKSNHIFTIWQHIVLLVLRQYENKSYRMFSEWLVEAYYLRVSLQLSHIPHYTTLQKFAARISSGTILDKIILSSFILLLNYVNSLFIGIDSSGFKVSNASELYRSSQTTKEVSQVIIKCRFTFSNYMHCQNKTSSYKTR